MLQIFEVIYEIMLNENIVGKQSSFTVPSVDGNSELLNLAVH